MSLPETSLLSICNTLDLRSSI